MFRGKAGCAACHLGPNSPTSDSIIPGSGLAADLGRFVASREPDRGAFKTPSLRDAARTPPYMHDGSLATLDDVIDYYDKGGRRTATRSGVRNCSLRPAKKALVAFFGVQRT